MSTYFVVSVGTSLVNWYNEHQSSEASTLPGYERDWIADQRGKGGRFAKSLKSFFEKSSFKKYELETASAELSSLLKDGDKAPNFRDPILLYHTETLSATACAEAIKISLEKLDYASVTCKAVAGLAEASAGSFYEKGLPNLVAELHQTIASAHTRGHQMVLIPTGGYKAIIPYFVLMGILFRIPCRYVHEESEQVMDLPPMPLHIDLCQWSSIESVLETLCEKPPDALESWCVSRLEPFRKSLRVLMLEKNGYLVRSPLCATLQDRARADRRRLELQFRTQNSPLLEYLVKIDESKRDERLKNQFLRLAEVGPYIWKGDRVPEMADHALHHHAALFDLAERLLLPVFYHVESTKDKAFLSPEELIVLLGALHLHDCGHVIGTVGLDSGDLRLLPTEIRDHHHVLGFLRLTEPELHGGTGRILHDKLKIDEIQNDELREYLSVVAVLGLYHRKKMKLKDNHWCYPFFNQKNDYLRSMKTYCEHNPLEVFGKAIAFDRAALMVCLLRVIDGLDEQTSRTGGLEAIAFHLAQIETEAKEEEDRAKSIRIGLTSIPEFKEAFDKMDLVVDRRILGYIEKEGKGDRDPELEKRLGNASPLSSELFRDELKECFHEHQSKVPEAVFLEYVHARLRCFFKQFQKIPYGEKAFVDGIVLTNCVMGSGDMQIDIDLNLVDDAGQLKTTVQTIGHSTITKKGKEMDMNFPAGRKDFRAHMLSEFQREYDAENGLVKQILNSNGLLLNYRI